MTRVALDSNIVVYFAGVAHAPDDDNKIARTRFVLNALSKSATLVAPVQALGEAFVVLRRSGFSATEARNQMIDFAEAFVAAPSSEATALAAVDLVLDHKLQFWDSLIISAAAEARCTLLLSEDMQDGFVARGLTIVNPLSEPVHAKLQPLLT